VVLDYGVGQPVANPDPEVITSRMVQCVALCHSARPDVWTGIHHCCELCNRTAAYTRIYKKRS